MTHPNENLIRMRYEAFARGDLAAATDIFADEISWLVPGHNKIAGQYVGREQVMGLFAQIMRLTEGRFALEVREVLANDARAVALVTVTATRDGQTRVYDSAQVWGLASGKAVAFQEFVGDQDVVDLLFA